MNSEQTVVTCIPIDVLLFVVPLALERRNQTGGRGRRKRHHVPNFIPFRLVRRNKRLIGFVVREVCGCVVFSTTFLCRANQTLHRKAFDGVKAHALLLDTRTSTIYILYTTRQVFLSQHHHGTG